MENIFALFFQYQFDIDCCWMSKDMTELILFEFLRDFYQTLGLIPSQSLSHQNYAFNWKTPLILLASTYFCISTIASMFLEGNSNQDHSKFIDSCYWAASAFQVALIFIITVSKMPSIIKVIGKFEEIIRNSKRLIKLKICFTVFWVIFLLVRHFNIESHNPILKDKYGKINARIDRMSKICCIILVEFSMPAIVIPSTLLTLVNYFVFNLGDDSYMLTMPVLYVVEQRKKQNRIAWFSH